MSPNDPSSPTPRVAKRLRFDRYVLDLDRGSLLLDGSEIALRPKTFAVLRYLVENSGRLVSKDELFAAVWPNLAITDDALVQSIGELRKALADAGPRLIKTIPRRGYRFESDVSIIAPVDNDRANSTASRDGAQTLKPVVPAHEWTLLTTAPTGWHRGLFAALAVLVLLAAGALLASRAGWSVLSPLRTGEQFVVLTKGRDVLLQP